jgi:methylglutaconyl-CoA hydratase
LTFPESPPNLIAQNRKPKKMDKAVLTHIENRLGTITLNRPEKRNAMSPDLIQAMKSALVNMEHDPAVRVVRIKAEGKAFCAGADLSYLQSMQNYSEEENLQDSENLMELFDLIYNFPKIIIAQVQGHALAGGCGLVTVCDFAFSAPDALFGYTEVRIGFVPALVSVFLQEQIGAAKTQELLLSGDLISAERAANLGLITQVTPAEHLDQVVLDHAAKLITHNSANSMMETKKLLRSLNKKERNQSLKHAAEINAKARAHEDCVKGISSFLSKEKPTW